MTNPFLEPSIPPGYNTPMSDLVTFPSREQIDLLQREMSKLPQITPVTEHYFSEAGMYCRKLSRESGTVIVGKAHKQPHLFICAAGEIRVWSEHGVRTLKAGDVIESQAGTKRVTLALTDAIGITVHKTDKTDLDEIEAELIEPDEAALFDARNLPRVILDLLEGQS
ncbi:MAG: hypothetical protein ACYCOU_23105 [Sulfobacillus sp.]